MGKAFIGILVIGLALGGSAPAGAHAPDVRVFALAQVRPELVRGAGLTTDAAHRRRPGALLITTAGFYEGRRPLDLLIAEGREVTHRLPLGRPVFVYDERSQRAWITHGHPGPVTLAFAAGPYFSLQGVQCAGYSPRTFCSAHTRRRALAVDTTGRFLMHVSYAGPVAWLPRHLGRRPEGEFREGLGLDGGHSAEGPIPVRLVLVPRHGDITAHRAEPRTP